MIHDYLCIILQIFKALIFFPQIHKLSSILKTRGNHDVFAKQTYFWRTHIELIKKNSYYSSIMEGLFEIEGIM